MTDHKNETFTDRRVDIDGNSFEGCTFERCQVVYSGGEHSRMVGCTFKDDCTFHLDGAASRTLAYLQSIYHNMGPVGVQLVEATFNAIRLNQKPSPPANA
jgi:hypothetical protein